MTIESRFWVFLFVALSFIAVSHELIYDWTPNHVSMRQTFALVGLNFIGVSGAAYVLVRRLVQAQELTAFELAIKTNETERAYRDFKESLEYAQRIQHNMLPNEDAFSELELDGFVYYQPKEMIGGDFYSFHEDDLRFTAMVGDATGHGVPGALTSILGMQLFSDGFELVGISSVSEILDFVRESVIKSYKHRNRRINDGMDAGIFSFNKISRKAEFAGANFRLFVVREAGTALASVNGIKYLPQVTQNGRNVYVIKGDRMSLSLSDYENQRFSCIQLQLEPNDEIFLTSDGYIDQFGGGIKNEKLKVKRFMRLLTRYYSRPSAMQQSNFAIAHENWKGKEAQTDDICLMGFKISD